MFPRRMEGFFLLAFAAHFMLFGLVKVTPGVFVVPGGFDHFKTAKTADKNKKINEPPEKEDEIKPPEITLPEQRKPEPEEMDTIVVIPVPANNRPKWIVELLDIPKEEEPEEANFVSERPSSVKEEVQAEITSREPKKKPKKKRTAKRKKTHRKNPRKVARKNKPKPMAKRTLQSKPKTEEKAAAKEKKKSGFETVPGGNLPVTDGSEEIARKDEMKPKTSDLVPTFGELALRNPPGKRNESRIPGDHGTVESPGRMLPKSEPSEDLPGVAEAPENFFPTFIKKRGNITMLNAKSYKYSSFVRRVARRMFDRFVVGFDTGAYSNANWSRIKRGARFEALMNPKGKLVSLKVQRKTGNSRFDSLVKGAVRKEAWDSNVPKGAECSDGLVHFIFIPRVVPSKPVDTVNGRVYTRFLLMATAGLRNCD